jgi:asparagine N-glycosylation enzyme membrane subunit Stt3
LSTLTVLLTFFLGKKLYGSRTGFLSALILATSEGISPSIRKKVWKGCWSLCLLE